MRGRSSLDVGSVRALEVGTGNLGAAVIALAGSGLRIGELLGPDVSHVDFLWRSIRVEGPEPSRDSGSCRSPGHQLERSLSARASSTQWRHTSSGGSEVGPLVRQSAGSAVEVSAVEAALEGCGGQGLTPVR
jgi:integrase